MIAASDNVPIIAVVLVAIFTSITAPVGLLYLTNRQRRADKKEDWERQDAVAAQAAEAARLLLASQNDAAAKAAEVADVAAKAAQLLVNAQAEAADKADVAAALLRANNEIVAATATETQEQLHVIHILVNSQLTAAMQNELDATQREIVMMTEVIDLKKAAGQQSSPNASATVIATQLRIDELRATLADRLANQTTVDKGKI